MDIMPQRIPINVLRTLVTMRVSARFAFVNLLRQQSARIVFICAVFSLGYEDKLCLNYV